MAKVVIERSRRLITLSGEKMVVLEYVGDQFFISLSIFLRGRDLGETGRGLIYMECILVRLAGDYGREEGVTGARIIGFVRWRLAPRCLP